MRTNSLDIIGITTLAVTLRAGLLAVSGTSVLACPGNAEEAAAPAVSQNHASWGRLSPGEHVVGFRSKVVFDTSRSYSRSSGELTSRPVQISIWYPAHPGPDSSKMPTHHYRFLVDRERELGAWSEEELSRQLDFVVRKAVQSGAPLEVARRIYGGPSAVTMEAPAKKGPFPLLIFSPSMLGSPMQNTVMCEYLASHGYIVAAHPSIGTAPPMMTTNPSDLEAQTRDIEFVLGYLVQNNPSVATARIGILGHSWGGLAALLAAARDNRIRAVVSLDGSEEMWKDLLDRAPEWDSALFSAAYLRLCKPPSVNEPDSGLFNSIRHAPTYRMILDDRVGHFEFLSDQVFSYLIRQHKRRDEMIALQLLVCTTVHGFFDTHVAQNGATQEFLHDEAETHQISSLLSRIERGPSFPPVLPDREFLKLIREQGVETALAAYERAVDDDPTSFSEARLLRLGEQLLWTGSNNDAAIKILMRCSDRFPESSRAQELLGNVYYWNRNDPKRALPHYQEADRLQSTSLQVEIYLKQIAQTLRGG